MGLLKSESYQKGIVISTAFNFLSKGILFFISILIGYHFVKEKLDFYFFIYASIFLLAFFFSALNVGVLIPESMRLKEQIGQHASEAFLNKFLRIYLFFALIIGVIIFVNPIGVFEVFSKFSTTTLIENKNMILMGTIVFGLMIVTNYLTDVLASYKFFSIPMIAQFINSMFALASILFLRNYFDIMSIFIGLIIAYFMNLFILIFLLVKRLKWNFLNVSTKIQKKVWTDILFAQTGNLASLLGSFAPNYLFSSASGIITSLQFGQKTANMPNDLISGQFSAVAGIRFNELYSVKEFKQINIVFSETVKALLFILIPIAGFISLFSEETIQLLYFRGAFSKETAEISSFFLKYFILLIPVFAYMGLVTRLMISSQQIKLNFYVQILINLIIIVTVAFGVKWFGYKGFAWAMILSTLLQLLTILIILRIKFNYISISETFIFCLKIVGIVIFILLLNYFLNGILLKISISVFWRLFIGFSLFSTIYLLANYFLNIRFEMINRMYEKLGLKK